VQNSTQEHPIRVDGSGVQRLLVAHNDLRNPGGKTSLRITMASDAWVQGNQLHHYVEVGGVPDPTQERDQRVDRAVVIGNTFHGELRIQHGAHSLLVQENVSYRDGQEAFSVRLSDSRWSHRSVTNLQLVGNVVYNASPDGHFLTVAGRSLGAVTMVGNTYVAPNLLVGGQGNPSIVRVMDEDLRSFRRVDANVWPQAQSAQWVSGGLFFVGSSVYSGSGAYRTLDWWNGQAEVGSDMLAAA
jgi:hypothetical protein